MLFGYRPPPYFGPSVTYQALMRSEFPRRFDVTFININVVESIGGLEKFRLAKLLKLVRFLVAELFYLLTRRFDYCCYPISFNRNAFLKDALLLRLPRWFGVPTVLYAHGNNLPDFYAKSSPRLQRFVDRTIARADAAIVMGENLRFNFERWLPPERIFVVGSGIEPAPALPTVGKLEDGLTVLYLGNLIREKGVFVLLEAIPKVLAKRNNVQFVFAGEWWREPDRLEAEQLIRQNGIGGNVRFAGVVTGDAKSRLLATADVLAFPTHYFYEAHPLVLLEAMQAGLPVVTTRRAAIPEIIQDGINGFLVREQDPSDLTTRLLQLLDDQALRERIGQANRQRFRDFYSHERYGERMIRVFEELSARGAVPERSSRHA